jgi:DNA-binding PadR family transcriptional regulator
MFDRQNFARWDGDMPFGRGFGPMFGHGGFGGPRRFFERGVIKYIILDLIKKQPRHGYDIIQELEGRFHGMYNPSAGTVYPILQLLEDQKYVTIDQKDGKKVYSITKDGEKYLSEHQEELEKMEHLREKLGSFGPDMHALGDEFKDVMKLVMHNARHGAFKDPGTVSELKASLARFRTEVEAIFAKSKKEDAEEVK